MSFHLGWIASMRLHLRGPKQVQGGFPKERVVAEAAAAVGAGLALESAAKQLWNLLRPLM